MNAEEPLGGRLRLRPGQPRPHNLRSTRPDWVGRLTRGLPAQRLGPTLASLFSLCEHAHRLCAALAIDAALGRGAVPTATTRAELARHTLREHLVRIGLDWPQRLRAVALDADSDADTAADAVDARTLLTCPALAAVPSDASGWLASQLLGVPPQRWLDAWAHDPANWLAEWSGAFDTPAARLLRAAAAGRQPVVALAVHANADNMRAWANDLRDGGPAFARRPTWHGACAETGVWTRLAEADPRRLDTPALRMAARVAEVTRLAAGETDRLAVGALALAAGEAVAWVEMSRGLLVHHVQLDGRGDAARVAACHVVAPTEWNFHPRGAMAAVLESLPGDVPARVLDTWAAAYDPCVPYQQESPVTQESVHA